MTSLNFKNTLFVVVSTGLLIAGAVCSPFTKTIGYYSVGQYYFFAGSLLLCTLLLLLYIIMGNMNALHFNRYDYLAISLFMGGCLYALFNPAYYHNEIWLTYMQAGCLWLIFVLTVKYVGFNTWLLSFSLLFLFELIVGLYQLIIGYIANDDLANTITGTFQHSGVYSCVLAILLVPAYITFRRAWYLFFPVLVTAILCVTKSRVGLSAVLFTHLIFYRHSIQAWIAKYITRNMRMVWAISGLLIVLFFFSIKRMSTEGRWLIWKTTVTHIDTRHIITGFGSGSFSARYPVWQAEYFIMHPGMPAGFLSADWTFSAFNMYLEIFIETGIAGLILFIILLYGYYTQVVKTATGSRQYLHILLPAIILFQALVYYAFYISINMVLLSFVFATRHFYITETNKHSDTTIKKYPARLMIKCTAWFLFAVLLISGINSIRTAKAVYQWQQLSKNTTAAKSRQLAAMMKWWSELKYNGKYVYDCGRLYFASGKYGAAITMFEECKKTYCNQDLYTLLATAYYLVKKPEMAERYQVLLTHIIPSRLIYKYKLFLLYLEQKKNDQAKQTGNELLALPIKMQGKMVDDILSHVKEELQKL